MSPFKIQRKGKILICSELLFIGDLPLKAVPVQPDKNTTASFFADKRTIANNERNHHRHN